MVIVQHPSEPNDREPGRYGKIIEFGGPRDRGRGYLAHSDRVGPSVLLLHEWFGLQDSFKEPADLLCDEGFTVLAPDLYDGAIAKDVDEAEALMKGLDQELTGRRVRAAAAFLIDNWHPRLGVAGFSLGASWAMWLAQEMTVEATAVYYGFGEAEPARWQGSLLGHFAEKDELDAVEDVKAYLAPLKEGGVDFEMHVYPGVGHWFANSAVPDAYDADAAGLAHRRTVEFFHHHLA